MPTYEYVCSRCNHRFELFQSMTEKPKRKCPQCNNNTAKRQIGAGMGIIFKGSGFYETDYKRKSPGKTSEGSSGAPAKGADASASSSGADKPQK